MKLYILLDDLIQSTLKVTDVLLEFLICNLQFFILGLEVITVAKNKLKLGDIIKFLVCWSKIRGFCIPRVLCILIVLKL